MYFKVPNVEHMVKYFSILLWFGCTEKISDSGNNVQTPKWSFIEQDDPRGAWLRVLHPTDAPEDIWIVGGQPEKGIVLRGSTNTNLIEVPLPSDTPLLNWIDGTSNNMWVGGLSGTILQWDGSEWNDHSLNVDEAIWGLEVTEESVVAVGGSSRWGGEQGIIWQYTNDSWNPSSIPDEIGEIGNFFKVVDDGQDFWVVGTQGIVLMGQPNNWTPIPTGITQDLITVIATETGEIEIVGGRGTGIHLTSENEELTLQEPLIAGINGIAHHNQISLLVGEMGYATFATSTTRTEIQPITPHILHAASVQNVDNSLTWYAVGGNLATANASYQGSILKMEWSP